MNYTLKKLFDESADIFFVDEAQNILSKIAERNLCCRLAIYMTPKLGEYGFNNYYADTEYNRKQGGRVKTILDDDENIITIQCDLIVHSRGEFLKNDKPDCHRNEKIKSP